MVQYLLVISPLPFAAPWHPLALSVCHFQFIVIINFDAEKGMPCQRPKARKNRAMGHATWVGRSGGRGRNRLAVDEFICVKFKCKYLRVLKGVFRGLMLDCYAIFLSSLSPGVFFGFGFGFWDLPSACEMIWWLGFHCDMLHSQSK